LREKPDVGVAGRLAALPSATKLVNVACGGDGVLARRVLDALIERDMFVRMPFAAPQNRAVRVGCGQPEEPDVFEREFPAALAGARSSR
jgi:histidinol-phosphate aminotransferase